MSIQIRLWLGADTDLQALRNFIFSSARCDHYVSEQGQVVYGVGDDQAGSRYNIGNSYNLIQINERKMHGGGSLELKVRAHASFMLNDNSKGEAWLSESIAASTSAIRTFAGDAVLVVQQVPIFYRCDAEEYINTMAVERLTDWIFKREVAQEYFDLIVAYLVQPGRTLLYKSFDGLTLGV